MFQNILILCSIIGLVLSNTIPTTSTTTTTEDYSSNIFGLIKHCAHQPEIFKCMKKQTVIVLDNIIRNNETWIVNDYISVNRDPEWDGNVTVVEDTDNLDGVLMRKLNNLADSKMIQFKIQPKSTEEEGESTSARSKKKKSK